MSVLLPAKDSLSHQVSFYHILLLMASLPFDQFYSHLILISFCVHTLIQVKKGNIKPLFTAKVLAIQAVFYITAIATVYTAYPQQAFAEWGRDIVIFILPLVFCLNTLDMTIYRPALLLGFAVCCTLTIIYLYANAFITIHHYSLPVSTIFSGAFTNHNFSEPIAMHATFFSMQVLIALVFMLYIIVKPGSPRLIKIICTVCGLVLLAGLIQLSSKSILITLFLILNLALPYCMLTGRKMLRFMAGAVAVSALIVVFIFKNDTFRDRYVKDLQTDLSPSQPGENVEPRLTRWGAAAHLIKASPVIGHGAGSEVSLLGSEFFNEKYYSSYLDKLNAHNQYLSYLIKAGIWGLAVYLLVLFYGFKIAIRNKDVVLISFMLVIAVVSFSENVLDVDKGVFFYGFFFTFLMFSHAEPRRVPNSILHHNNLYGLATN